MCIHLKAADVRGSSLYTSVQALYGPKTLGLLQPGDTAPPADTWFFVYGGSSSVGQYAVQLAKLSGYRVATVASPHNFKLVQNFGADVVFDVGGGFTIALLRFELADCSLPFNIVQRPRRDQEVEGRHWRWHSHCS